MAPDDQQDSFLYDRYNSAPPAPANVQQTAITAWTQNPDFQPAPPSPDQAHAATVQLNDQSRVADANNIIADPSTPDPAKLSALQDHAAKLGTPDTAQATVGMAQSLAASSGESVPASVADRQAWDKRQAAVAQIYSDASSKYGQDAFVGNNPVIDANGKTKYGALAENGAAWTGWAVANIAKEFFSPDSQGKLLHIMQQYVPDAKLSDYAHPSDMMNEFGRVLASADPDNARKIVGQITSTIDQGDILGGKNPVAQTQMFQTLMSLANDQHDHGWGANTLNALSMLGPLGSVGDVAKIGAKAVSPLTGVLKSLDHIDLSGVLRDVIPSPSIPVGTPADAATLTTAGATQAVAQMSSTTGAANLAARGVAPQQVAGSLILPNFRANLDDLGRPMVDPYYYNESMRPAVDARVKAGFDDMLGVRVKDTTLGALNGDGFHYTARFGSVTGKGFSSQPAADAVASNLLGSHPYKIVQDVPIGGAPGKFYVQVEGLAQPGLQDVGATPEPLTRVGSLVTRLFGRETAYTPYFNSMLSAASRRSDLALGAAQANLKPYFNLASGSKSVVNALLEESDRSTTWLTQADLVSRGVPQKAIEAYQNIQQFAAKDWSMANFNARETLLAKGARDFTANGESSIAQPVLAIPKGAKVLDLSTGKSTSSTMQAGDKAVEFLDARSSGETHGIIRSGQKPMLNDLPQGIINQVPGYLLRRNEFTHYVRNMTDNSMEVGAMSADSATQQAAKLAQQYPGKTYQVFRAQEIDPNARATLPDDIQRLKDQQLFYTNQRNPTPLLGIDGNPRLMAPEDALKQMVTRYSNNAGVKRFVQVMTDDLNARAKAIDPNAQIALGTQPTLPSGRLFLTADKALQDISQVQGHLEMMSGMSKFQVLPAINRVRAGIADAMYNLDTKLNGPAGSGGALNRSVANNISGMTNSFERAGKSAAFLAYLGTNVLRNPFLHTSMLPETLALEGVGKYALSGGYFNDMLGFTKGVLSDGKLAPTGDAAKLFDLWQQSGMQAGVKAHLLTSQSIFDTGTRLPGLLDDTVGTALRGLKTAGFDAAITLNKMSAMAAVVRRFRAQNGMQWPATDAQIDKITHDTEAFTLNMNRTDPMPTQNGMLGVITQFAGYHLKAMSRMLCLDGNWTPKERAGMALITLGSYGADGLRVGAALDMLEGQLGHPLDPRVRELIHQGVYGTLYNTVISAATQPDKELAHWGEGAPRSMVDFSGSIAPYSFAGPDVQTLGNIFHLGVNMAQTEEHPYVPAAFQLFGTAGDVVKFGRLIGGQTDLPLTDKVKATAVDALRHFPLTSNILKAAAIANQGVSIDSRGNPIAHATNNEMIAALSGFTASDTESMRTAQAALHGQYAAVDRNGLQDALRTQATQNGAILVEAMNNIGQGKTAEQLTELMRDHTNLMTTLLSPSDKRDYFKYLSDYVTNRSQLQTERVVKEYIHQMSTEHVRLDGKLDDALNAQHFEGSDQIKQWVTNQQDLRGFVGHLFNDEDEK